MYNYFRKLAERLLRIPHDPETPPGDEASARLFRAAPNFFRYLLFLWAAKAVASFLFILITVLLPFGVLGFTLTKKGNPWAGLLWLLPLAALALHVLCNLFLLAILRLNFEKRWYVVTDRSLRIRAGVTTVREMTVTFANIQNISVSQGPLQRLLRIADLRVDTAGGGGATQGKGVAENLHTAWFHGIDNANEVRDLIQQRLRHLKDSGLGHQEEMVVSPTPASSPALVSAIREIHREAAALRRAVAQG